MTLFDHFRPGRLSRQSTRSNPSSRAASPTGSSPKETSRSGTPHSNNMGHFTALFTHHSDTHAHAHSEHSSSKKREYEFFPHAPPIGSGGYSEVIKARWIAREGRVVAVKVVRKEAVKDHAEYLKIIGP
jgi:hypothetical protein